MFTPIQLNYSPSSFPQQPSEQPQSPEIKSTRESHQTHQFVSPITISDLQFLEEPTQNNQNYGQKTFRTNNHHATANAANIFRVKFGNNAEKRDRLTYVRYENYTSARSRKTTQQKIFQINNFVKKLTANMDKEDQVPEISQTKFKALKKIIQYYDIKNLDRSEYSNVIKSFGLQIGSVRAQKKPPAFSQEKRSQIKKLRALSLFRRTQKNITAKGPLDLTLDESQQLKIQSIPARQIMSQQQSKTKSPRAEGSKHMFNSLQIRKDKLKTRSPKKFKFTSGQNCILQKVNKYREFLFVLNYSNKLYRPLDVQEYPIALKYFVGRGNNGNLIRSLMKRRFWFQQTTVEKQAHFVWTQIKVPKVFARQNGLIGLKSENSITSQKISSKLTLQKGDPLGRILIVQQVKEIVLLQDLVKSRNLHGFEDRLRLLSKKIKRQQIGQFQTTHNHLPGNGLLGNKKGMFLCLRQYCKLNNLNVFDIVPKTFIISHGLLDPEYNRVAAYYSERKQEKKHNYWIIKPGEFSNRGNGIQCTNKLQDIKKRVTKTAKEKKKSSLIVQQYIVRPLLYNGRKFDIRAYMIVTWHNGKAKAYWYQEGYVRTSSAFFNLGQMSDPYIHLTNDAVQKNSDQYGQFQDGNKLSYPQLQRYLDSLPALGRNLDLHNALIPKMKEIAGITVKSAWFGLNRENKDKNFQLFGLDFMVDEDFKPWLIEVNTNPCLELSSPVLQRLIPYMVENVLRISLDTLFPPPNNFTNNYKYNIPQNSLHYNKFQLIFDSDRDGPAISALYEGKDFYKEVQGLEEDKNEYKQDGELINIEDM